MTIYLDTARMGRFCRRSQLTVTEFLSFHFEEGSSVHFDEFVRCGFSGANTVLRDKFPRLTDWHGVESLKTSLRHLANAEADSEVFLAASSAQLMRIGAKAMFSRCKNVMTLDNAWPDYVKWLDDECERSARQLSTLRVQDSILRDGITKEQLLRKIVTCYQEQGCDGLFIPAVTNLGIRLPYTEIIEAIRRVAPLEFVIVDGAQDFCHAPTDLRDSGADMYVTGCHKWMQAYLPMRIAFCCREKTQEFIRETYDHLLRTRVIDDPLLRFVRQLETNDFDPFTETANLLPLFSCAAAVVDQLTKSATKEEPFGCQLENANQLCETAATTGWYALLPKPEFRSGVVLMRHENPVVRGLGTDLVRSQFRDRGISVSAYDCGTIRLSMPRQPWQRKELEMVRKALASFDTEETARQAVAYATSGVEGEVHEEGADWWWPAI